MTTQHTPGPWHTAGRVVRDAYGNKVTEVATARHIVEGTPEANARLIAAAPRMSDALKRAAHILAELPDQSPHLLAIRTEIVACIKQATPEHYGVQS